MLAVAEHNHIQSELIPRLVTGFCGGLAHTGGTCGAVSGGIMAIGLFLGRNSPADLKDPCYQAVRSFIKQFTAQFGSVNCQTLTGVHLGTPEGQAMFQEKGQMDACTNYVGEATRMVLDLGTGLVK